MLFKIFYMVVKVIAWVLVYWTNGLISGLKTLTGALLGLFSSITLILTAWAYDFIPNSIGSRETFNTAIKAIIPNIFGIFIGLLVIIISPFGALIQLYKSKQLKKQEQPKRKKKEPPIDIDPRARELSTKTAKFFNNNTPNII